MMRRVPAPAAEIDVDAELVRALLRAQHPDLAELPLERGPEGWDNVSWRLGDALVVRLPRRELAASLIEHEQRWLPDLSRRLPLPVPAPVRIGRPGSGFPWAWSIVPWLDGEEAALCDLDQPVVVGQLADFFAALHQRAPSEAPANPFRGGPITQRPVPLRLDTLELSADRLLVARQVWQAAASAPAWAGPRFWLHGDPHPRNLLSDGRRLTGVLDFGDLTSGDPATDLASAWLLLERPAREAMLTAYVAAGPDWLGATEGDALRDRARGWALHYALTLQAHVAGDPVWDRVIAHAWRQLEPSDG